MQRAPETERVFLTPAAGAYKRVFLTPAAYVRCSLFELTYSPDHEVLFVTRFDGAGEISVEIVGHSMTLPPVVLGDFDWQKTVCSIEVVETLDAWAGLCRAFLLGVIQSGDELGLSLDGVTVQQDVFTVMKAMDEAVTIELDELEIQRAFSLLIVAGPDA